MNARYCWEIAIQRMLIAQTRMEAFFARATKDTPVTESYLVRIQTNAILSQTTVMLRTLHAQTCSAASNVHVDRDSLETVERAPT